MAETGPTDRTPFFEFQARNRRATWRLTLAYALVVAGCGFVSAIGFAVNVFLVLFAMVFIPAVLCLAVGALMLLSPATSGLTPTIWDLGLAPLGVVGRLPSLLPGDGRAIWAIGFLVPLACWLAVRSVWLAAGVGHTLLAIGARPPKDGDLEEHQLVNVVQEMAIAAGIPAPAVRLLDAKVANAAAIGRDPTESYVVVGRRLLDEFDREETEGLLAHLIGSIGNGDLRGAAQIHSLLIRVGAPDRRGADAVRALPGAGRLALVHVPARGVARVGRGARRTGARPDPAPHGAPGGASAPARTGTTPSGRSGASTSAG
jgi:Zn-dependent protease with chaperone function